MKGNILPLPTEDLRAWFLKNKRDLPWREGSSPYRIWVSEVMLQQTQVAVVLGYFTRWMERFPTLSSLAEASLEEVIKMWEGLGYYSRARNLYKGAKYLMDHHGGELPTSREALERVPGIGSYTAGAILSFAFRKKAAAVDGNVLRVLSRYRRIEEDITEGKTRRKIAEYTEAFLPEQEPWVIMEALIELGALVCMKQPRCFECPLQKNCLGLKAGIADLLPIKGRSEAVTVLERDVFVVFAEGEVLLSKGKQGQIMADLYEFPYQEKGGKFLGLTGKVGKSLPIVKHTFTRFRVTLSPHVFYLDRKRDVPGYMWIGFRDLSQIPFSSGHRRILQFLQAL